MTDVLIVGAGLAGLACAHNISQQGLSCSVLEASDGVGGRARTDRVEGFLLDRGFQVFLTAYPEAQRVLDYKGLDLRSFEPGALVRFEGKFHRVSDPWRRPTAALETLFAPIGTLKDKIKMAQLRRVLLKSSAEGSTKGGVSTMQFLCDFGFSANLIERFFRPFLGGIFLERELETSSRRFAFVFRMFSLGEGALPARGMGAIAAQLAAGLPEGSIRLGEKVVQVEPGLVTVASGNMIAARFIVVATDQTAASQLLSQPAPWRSTSCFYFAAKKAPVSQPILVLNGEGRGPINNLCVPSLVAPSYAPSGAHLVSASVVGPTQLGADELLRQVREQLAEWFGAETRDWRHLRTDWIPNALPSQTRSGEDDGPVRPGVFVCGDYRETASINGALVSGRKTAEAVLAAAKS
jgi:phytoene dehydrogenase-like protein